MLPKDEAVLHVPDEHGVTLAQLLPGIKRFIDGFSFTALHVRSLY